MSVYVCANKVWMGARVVGYLRLVGLKNGQQKTRHQDYLDIGHVGGIDLAPCLRRGYRSASRA